MADVLRIRHGPDLTGITFEFHAGAAYRQPLESLLQTMGATCICPVDGMRQGQRLAYYKEMNQAGQTAEARPKSARSSTQRTKRTLSSEPVVKTATEAEFHDQMLHLHQLWYREYGYRAPRFLQLVRNRGGVAAAEYLLRQQATSQGFDNLRHHGGLAHSVEALVLQPRWGELFTAQYTRAARDKLHQAGFKPEVQ